MPTLRRYLIRRFLAAFAGSLVALIGIVLIVDLLLHVDEIFESEGTPAGVATLLLLRTFALYLPYLLPVACFFGAFLAVGLAAQAHEIVAIKTAGISPLRAILPILVVATLVAGAALALNETVGIRAAADLERRAGGGRADLYRTSGGLWYQTGRFVYNVRSTNEAGDRLEEVRVFERDESGHLVRLIEAARAERLDPTHWRFFDAQVRRFGALREPPVFESAAEVVLELAEAPSRPRLREDLATIPVWLLARSAPGEPRARSVLHERLSQPLVAVVLVLLAVGLGLRVEQARTLATPAAQAALLLFLLLTVRESGSRLLQPGAHAVLASWLGLALFASYGVLRLARTPR